MITTDSSVITTPATTKKIVTEEWRTSPPFLVLDSAGTMVVVLTPWVGGVDGVIMIAGVSVDRCVGEVEDVTVISVVAIARPAVVTTLGVGAIVVVFRPGHKMALGPITVLVDLSTIGKHAGYSVWVRSTKRFGRQHGGLFRSGVDW
jgi:hypothetical protein